MIEDERPEAKPAKVKFYTASWHVLLGRGVNSDADGAYSDATGRSRSDSLGERSA